MVCVPTDSVGELTVAVEWECLDQLLITVVPSIRTRVPSSDPARNVTEHAVATLIVVVNLAA